MKPKILTDIRFMKEGTAFLLWSDTQSVVMNRYRSIEEMRGKLFGFGYNIWQYNQVLPWGNGYHHLLVLSPWKPGVELAQPHGGMGFTISTRIVTEYEDQTVRVFEPGHTDGRAPLIYTPPVDVKRQTLAPMRFETFSFPGLPDGSFDFSSIKGDKGDAPEEYGKAYASFVREILGRG